MAAADQFQHLRDELSCPICLEYFTEPVSLDCGHDFCTLCITLYLDKVDGCLKCPQCREKSRRGELRENRKLANLVEIVKLLREPSVLPPPVESLCPEHDEKLKLFCEVDQRTICVVCSVSQEHKQHAVVPVEEAFRGYRQHLQSHIQALKRNLQDVLEFQSQEKKKLTDLQKETENERQRIVFEFEELHKYLKERQHSLLTRLNEYEHEGLVNLRKNVSQLEEQEDYLKSLVTELEEKFQLPACSLLKDVRKNLSRLELPRFQRPQPVSLEPKRYFQPNFPRQYYVLLRMSAVFTEKLVPKFGANAEENEWRTARCFAVDVTLDPETANSMLYLSEDRKTVTYTDSQQKMPESPKRFLKNLSVLGCQAFTSGKHYWEVDVAQKIHWALGVCKDSIPRDKVLTFGTEHGFWRMGLANGEKYWAGSNPVSNLKPRTELTTVGIFLDYEAGKITFYNVAAKSQIFTFTDKFMGCLRPYFGLSMSSNGIRLCPVTEWE